MELNEFVAETLKQLIDGVESAQKYAIEKKNDTSVNPVGLYRTEAGKVGVSDRVSMPMPQMIEFDVAVTVAEGGQAKSGIGVVAGIFGIGAQAQVETANTNVTRIRFSVPVVFSRQNTAY